jgi:hypothetical protein
VLLINVHQLDVILAEAIRFRIFEGEVDHIRRIFRFESENIFVLSSSKNFRKGGEVDAKRNVAVTAEWGEGFGLEHHGDEGDVGVVHCLERDAGVIAVEVAVLDEIFDGIDDLIANIRIVLGMSCGSPLPS